MDRSLMPDRLNDRAVSVILRVSKKLTGRDFGDQPIDVPTQVTLLTRHALT
jgi:hypothetical protein